MLLCVPYAHNSHSRQVFSWEIVRDVLDTELETRPSQQEALALEPRQVAFLLADLERKACRALHPPKEAPFATVSSTAGFSGLLQQSQANVC